MEFSKQNYCNGLPFPIPGHLPDPGIELESLASPALAGRFITTVPPRKPYLSPPFYRYPEASDALVIWGHDITIVTNCVCVCVCVCSTLKMTVAWLLGFHLSTRN